MVLTSASLSCRTHANLLFHCRLTYSFLCFRPTNSAFCFRLTNSTLCVRYINPFLCFRLTNSFFYSRHTNLFLPFRMTHLSLSFSLILFSCMGGGWRWGGGLVVGTSPSSGGISPPDIFRNRTA